MLKHVQDSCKTLYLAAFDSRIHWGVKLFLILIIAYLLSPIDLIPDFIPVIGFLDEAILIPLLLKVAANNIPKELMEEYRNTSVNLSNSRFAYLGLAMVISIWLFILILTAYLFYSAF